MIEIHCDLWQNQTIEELKKNESVILCVTTNGTVKKNGAAVMGRGYALEAKNKILGIDEQLGKKIKESGNKVNFLQCYPEGLGQVCIYAFPVKHNWWEDADLKLIEKSCLELKEIKIDNLLPKVLLPRPGCGNGKLDWETQVRPLVESILDEDRFIIVNK